MRRLILPLLSALSLAAPVLASAEDVAYSRYTLPEDPQLDFAVWAPEAKGNYPLVILSHGLGGGMHDLSELAGTLANNGFVAAAPQHATDRLFNSDQYNFAVENRGNDLLRIKDWAASSDEGRALIDSENIGVFGYSQGGLSVLIAAGATPDRTLARDHCRNNRMSDIGFCGISGGPPFWVKILFWLGIWDEDGGDEENNFRKDLPHHDFQAVGVAAPVGVMVSKEHYRNIKGGKGIFQFESDRALAPAFHSGHLHDALGDEPHTFKQYKGEGHGGLFGRQQDRINQDIVEFFDSHLK